MNSSLSFDLAQWMLPGQRPSDWHAPTPIELLPALRGRYPTCLDETLLSVQLVNRPTEHRSPWHLIAVRAGQRQYEADAMEVAGHPGRDHYFGDVPAQAYTWQLLDALLDSSRVAACQSAAEIFQPATYHLMQRIERDALDARLEFLTAEHPPDRVLSHRCWSNASKSPPRWTWFNLPWPASRPNLPSAYGVSGPAGCPRVLVSMMRAAATSIDEPRPLKERRRPEVSPRELD